MTYQMTEREKYAEAHAQARIDLDSAQGELRDVEIRATHTNNRLNTFKAKTLHTTAAAHEGLDRMAADAESVFTSKLESWINTLLRHDAKPPSGDIAAAWLLRDETFVAAMHAEIDKAGADPGTGYITEDRPADLQAEIDRLKVQVSEERKAIEVARANVKDAADRFDEFERGRGRVAA